MYKMTLNNVIAIEGLFSGYSFREKIDPNPNGSVGVLQMKDIQTDYSNFDYQSLDKVNEFQFKEKFFLNKGDIVFVSKGVNNYAIVIEQLDFRIVASATFFIIRVDEKKIIPEYLAWYMNQKEAQNYFSEKKAGTYVPNLNKQDIMDLPLKVPPLQKQNAIAKTAILLNKEIDILEKLKANRKQLIQTQLINLINND
jgi:restriction endonuclease S subunit